MLAAAACLPAGFAVAVLTGVRPLGGVVLLGLALLAARGLNHPLRWLTIVLACFIASHVLAHFIGAWAAVTVVTVIATAAAYADTERGWRAQSVTEAPSRS